MPDLLQHPPHLTIPALVEHELDLRRPEPAHPRRSSPAVLELDACGESLEGVVARLRNEPGKDIAIFGGGDLFRSLLAAGLVDEVAVSVIPALLGGGVPLLPAPADRARLKLKQHRVYPKSGTVGLDYDIVSK